MSKPLEWPLAKIRKEDKCPAIWFSWGVWHAVRAGLINSYLSARTHHGRSEARIAANKRDDILDVWRTELVNAKDALEIYRIGFAFNVPKPEEYPDLYITPANLVKLGDKHEREAFEQKLKDLWEGPILGK